MNGYKAEKGLSILTKKNLYLKGRDARVRGGGTATFRRAEE